MGELFRSREMQLVQMYIQNDAVHDTLEELGKHDLVHFRDLNPEVSAFQRHFVDEIKRTDEMHRSLRYFMDQVRTVERLKPHAFYNLMEDGEYPKEPSPQSLDNLHIYFDELQEELKEIEESQRVLNQNFYELTEMKFVLQHATHLFDTSFSPESGMDSVGYGIVGYLTGTIDREKVPVFERLMWRVTRGNLHFLTSEIQQTIYNPFTDEYVEKNVIVLCYQGETTRHRMERICTSFNVSLYPCPAYELERQPLLNEVETKLTELRTVLDKSASRQANILHDIYLYGSFWKDYITKEKYIYHCMNLFEYDLGRSCFIAEGWCPTEYLEQLQDDLETGFTRSSASVRSILSVIPTNEVKPTFQKTNDFTEAFQNIVDMYGIARYQEVNPGLFTIITFPFLFGVMFGDVGHGSILLLFALGLLLVWKMVPNPSENVQNMLYSKWLILLMALFSIYCGFMYNEIFSLPMGLFKSNWAYDDYITPTGPHSDAHQVDPNYCYPFGVDPLWKGSKNELDYYNSLKMKLSVILGVTQMTLGICLSLLNYRFFNEKKRIICEFLPQILFLNSIFGYMCFLIILKWTTVWDDASRAPRILNLLTEMILSPWTLSEKFTMFYGQHFVQIILLGIAAICMPWMLLASPLTILYERKKKAKQTLVVEIPMVEVGVEGNPQDKDMYSEDTYEEEHSSHSHHDEDISEVFIHQGIHTIEFILGCVSNTASYLRLWALSLAHSELSAVFWERVLLASLQTSNTFFIFCGWSVWAVLTMGVLLGMESLSAFLHALRLHWVEFQNKFYMGDGYKFAPFSFKTALTSEEDVYGS
mmetsp:Transcript_34621/g.59354  ORF Transcript_34621/g.59354 Transcript_34621/m.59354 type:complete len:816 (-) Transcript_34621:68-2515(-)